MGFFYMTLNIFGTSQVKMLYNILKYKSHRCRFSIFFFQTIYRYFPLYYSWFIQLTNYKTLDHVLYIDILPQYFKFLSSVLLDLALYTYYIRKKKAERRKNENDSENKV